MNIQIFSNSFRTLIFTLLAIVALGFWYYYFSSGLNLKEIASSLIAYLEQKGALTFIAVYVLSCLILLPGGVLTYSAGIAFGAFWGGVYVLISATLGASLAFILSRYFFRAWVERKVEEEPSLQSLDRAVLREGWKIVLLSRLCIFVPFRISNYVFGVTSIPFLHYSLATLIGVIPSAFVYVYAGTTSAKLSSFSWVEIKQEPALMIIPVIGLLLLVAILRIINKISKRALLKRLALG